MNTIHPTAIIDPRAELGKDNFIGPFCIVGPNVKMGNGNRLEAHISIGTPGEHRDYFRKEPGPVVMGNDCVIREFVTINGGTVSKTTVGDRVVMLRGSHLGHDSQVRTAVNLSCNVLIGGHSIIGQGANLGLSATVHQHRVVGAYTMVGMNSTVTKHVIPFVIAYGSPCAPYRVNRIGLTRGGLPEHDLQIFEDWYQSIRASDSVPAINHAHSRFLTEYHQEIKSLAKLTEFSEQPR